MSENTDASNANNMDMDVDMNGRVELTDAESEVYDRQIRLWGLDAQKRLRAAKIFISGMNGLGAEVAKNLILAGVDSVMLHDEKCVAEEDLCAQFFISKDDLGKNRAEASIQYAKYLNPHVKISTDNESLSKKTVEFCAQFNVMLLIEKTEEETLHINSICHKNGIKFFSGDIWGLFGYFFCDLQKHKYFAKKYDYKKVRRGSGKPTTELVSVSIPQTLAFKDYSNFLSFDCKKDSYRLRYKRCGPAFEILRILQSFRKLKGRDPSVKTRDQDIAELTSQAESICAKDTDYSELLECLFGQVSPACGVVGGVMVQEIIRVLTEADNPIGNVFFFDPIRCVGFSEMTTEIN